MSWLQLATKRATCHVIDAQLHHTCHGCVRHVCTLLLCSRERCLQHASFASPEQAEARPSAALGASAPLKQVTPVCAGVPSRRPCVCAVTRRRSTSFTALLRPAPLQAGASQRALHGQCLYANHAAPPRGTACSARQCAVGGLSSLLHYAGTCELSAGSCRAPACPQGALAAWRECVGAGVVTADSDCPAGVAPGAGAGLRALRVCTLWRSCV